MFNAEAWQAKIEGGDCPMCREEKLAVVAERPSGRVVLTDDADFPGYCILVYRRHVTELHELSREERAQLMEDVAHVARVLNEQLHPAKLNYAILGNEVPHIHCHIIPRSPDDPYWGAPIWKRPPGQTPPLPPENYTALAEKLRAALI